MSIKSSNLHPKLVVKMRPSTEGVKLARDDAYLQKIPAKYPLTKHIIIKTTANKTRMKDKIIFHKLKKLSGES